MMRWIAIVLQASSLLRCHTAQDAPPPGDPLRGEYGFLTNFGPDVLELEARQSVRKMSDLFGIREFQFYDAFESYSEPPPETKQEWKCAAFGRAVSRKVLEAYTDEIRQHGGRSWLYVQAMATAPGDDDLQQAAGVTLVGQHVVDGNPLLDAVAPTATWGRYIAPRWAAFAASLGFSGIHWDTLGDFRGEEVSMSEAGADLPAFLRAAKPLLAERGLAQTANFVDGFGWNATLFGTGWYHNTVAFPYWEVWTVPELEDRFFHEVKGGGVFVCYPGKGPSHTQRQNALQQGVWPLDLMIARWQKSRCHQSTYLAIGDGFRHIQNEYFPDTAEIGEADVAKIRDGVFKYPPTCQEDSREGYFSPLSWPYLVVAGVVALAIFACLASRCRSAGRSGDPSLLSSSEEEH